ncbi:HhH-GPD-type base excision DNA repair protein [Arthrobacter sp. KNU-44]|uniref:HhH-GPD-type base excision DNA repair protein n=1 Tax=unclassified Arthrobacter TaxID=235627 RepID=UPI003F4445CA
MELHITGDPAADQLLSDDAFALLIGMLLDQQVTMESAFAGPEKIRTRIGSMSPAAIAEYDPAGFVEVFKERPSVHRFPGSMAGRVQDLAAVVQRDWNGDATAIWTQDEPDGQEVLRRLKELPGFGEQKAKIFLALLGKQRGLQAQGWREAAGAYGRESAFLSVADIVDPESLRKVRANKQAAKAAIKAAKASGS